MTFNSIFLPQHIAALNMATKDFYLATTIFPSYLSLSINFYFNLEVSASIQPSSNLPVNKYDWVQYLLTSYDRAPCLITIGDPNLQLSLTIIVTIYFCKV